MADTGPRVLWVSPTINSSFGGPTTTTVNGLVAEKRAGIRSSLISTNSDDDEAGVAPALARLAADGVDVGLFPRTKLLAKAEAWGFSPRMALWMFRHMKEFDVVHLQYVWCMSSICGSILARIHGIPLVITPHESLTDYDIDVASKSRIKRRVKLVLRQHYLRTADRLVFMSDLEKRDTRYGSTPAELISHAVQEEAVPVAPPDRSGTHGPLRIGFLGRNIPKKGIALIIEALGRNRDRGWKLMIAGPPGTDEFVADTRALADGFGVAADVEWLGFLGKRADLFEDCDVLTMPSAYEGFGMVAAEAMCHGVPVIVPRNSGVAEIVSEFGAGIVMPESSVDNLERALLAMDEGPAVRQAFATKGIEAANSKLTYDAYARLTSALYASLLSAGSAGPAR